MYAFVHIDKTGGTTLNAILRRSFGAGHCDIRLPLVKRRHDGREHRSIVEAADLRRVRRLYRNLRGIAGHNVRAYAGLEAECPQIRFFTFLRDPAARFRSHFLNRSDAHARADFERWLDDPWNHNWQTRMIAGQQDAHRAIELIGARFGFVGLLERFDESLVMLGLWLAEPHFRGEYRRVNQLSDKRRPEDIARETIDLSYLESAWALDAIRAANAEDQQVYDFVVRDVFPRQLAAWQDRREAELAALKRRNRRAGRLAESLSSRFMRNYVYKPLLHCRVL